MDLRKELDSVISALKAQRCDQLIVDLRGNIGGGLGFARLASYLCPDEVPIGYSLTPDSQRKGFKMKEFAHVVYPDSRLGFALTLGRFAFCDKSIFLLTQGLGPQPFHGRVTFLVNEWTNSAAEMVAGFASEKKLATIVGTKTAGNVLGATNVKIGGGYWLRLPVFGWYNTNGESIEGRGVTPDVFIEPDPESLSKGIDTQLNAAIAVPAAISGTFSVGR